jgi:hypothetical protein
MVAHDCNSNHLDSSGRRISSLRPGWVKLGRCYLRNKQQQQQQQQKKQKGSGCSSQGTVSPLETLNFIPSNTFTKIVVNWEKLLRNKIYVEFW